MTDFTINNVSKSKLTDKGITVKELLKLLNEDDDLTKAFLKALKIDNLKDDFIKISGANKLVSIQKEINENIIAKTKCTENKKRNVHFLHFFTRRTEKRNATLFLHTFLSNSIYISFKQH